MPNTILEVCEVSKSYGNSHSRKKAKKGQENVTQALKGISFSLNEGEIVAIMGPSGSGKSTLLNCISTIDVPTEGHILVAGKDITRMKTSELSEFRRKDLGFVFQDANLLDTLTIRENIALALTINHAPTREIDSRISALAQKLSIESTLDRYPYEVSGGQRQRAAAARAVITKPYLILADEPTGALDTKSAHDLLDAFLFLNKLGATIVIVTHDSVVASYCERVLFLRDGKLLCQLQKEEHDRKSFAQHIIETTTSFEEGDSYAC